MPNFTFNCPHCNQQLEAQDEWGGLETNCPSCNSSIIIPNTVKTTQQQLKLNLHEVSGDTNKPSTTSKTSQLPSKKSHWKKLFVWSSVGCSSVILLLFLSVLIPAISKAKQKAAQIKTSKLPTSSAPLSNQPNELEVMGITIDGNVFHVSKQFQQKGLRFVKHKEQGDLPGVFLEGAFWQFQHVEFGLYYYPASKNIKAIRIDVPALPYNSSSENLLVDLKNNLTKKYGVPLDTSKNKKVTFSWILPYGEVEFSMEYTGVKGLLEEKIWVQIIYYSKNETMLRNELRNQVQNIKRSINSDL